MAGEITITRRGETQTIPVQEPPPGKPRNWWERSAARAWVSGFGGGAGDGKKTT